jgi:hypothetical protein
MRLHSQLSSPEWIWCRCLLRGEGGRRSGRSGTNEAEVVDFLAFSETTVSQKGALVLSKDSLRGLSESAPA